MKKSILFRSFLLLVIFPSYLCAQEIQLPTVEIRVSKDLVPAMVKDAVLNDFGTDHKPFAWVNSSSIFNTHEWAQVTDPKIMDIYSYGLHSKTNAGSTLDALYGADGKLINAREYFINFKPSRDVMLALQNTEYSDWGIKKDLLIIKHFSNGSEKEHYALVMIKGNEKKTVLIDGHGKMLAEKRGVHEELADLNW
jgi:hypothetical protein